MNIGEQGLALIQNYEECRLTAYNDGAGVITIGWGHTGGVMLGAAITQTQADNLLKADLARFVHNVNTLVTVDINQNQFDALVSFDYNTGALGKSTLLVKLNAGDDASQEFLNWVYADGHIMRGLVKRRNAEMLVFNGSTAKDAIAQSEQPEAS